MSTVGGSNQPKKCSTWRRFILVPEALRVHDLIAKTADVSLHNALRVLLALRTIARAGDVSADEILKVPYQAGRPTQEAAQHCDEAYLWLYDIEDVAKTLFEIEQLQ